MDTKTQHEQLLDLLRRELSDDGIAVVDLYDRCYRYRHGTLSRALRELVKRGDAVRRWDGNSRFGRWLYSAASETDREIATILREQPLVAADTVSDVRS